ncbi:MAG: hypothetical protein AAB285_04870 [candidate division NC10 bacterium]
MARIVLGIGSSHSPQVSTPPEFWAGHAARDMHVYSLFDRAGNPTTYERLLADADPELPAQLTPEVKQRRHEACQAAIGRLAARIEEVAPDVVVIIGEDQHEIFHEDCMPALLVYWGDTLVSAPHPWRTEQDASLRAAAWGYGWDEVREFPVASELGERLIEELIERGFDVAHARYLKEGQAVGHAFGFAYRRLLGGKPIPTLPVMLNTHYPPNQPTARRCFEIGRVIRETVQAWKSDARVGVVATGGLTHFVIDEQFDHELLRAMKEKDAGKLCSIPQRLLNSGTSEVRSWITAAVALADLDMEIIDYQPCYRTPAGTGMGMGFAEWR